MLDIRTMRRGTPFPTRRVGESGFSWLEKGAGSMETRIGKVTHYFNKISVAVLDLSADLKVGDTVHFLGHSTDFSQTIDSMEIDHKKVESAGPKQEVALKTAQPVHEGAEVLKVA
jgi:putative protease